MRFSRLLLAALVVCGVSLWAAPPTSPFTQCPGVGSNPTGCQLLIDVTAVNGSGVATAFTVYQSTTDIGPFDGGDDTLVGVRNSSGGVLKVLSISGGTGSNIVGFENDGACSGFYSPNPPAALCPGGAFTTTDPQDYGSSTASWIGYCTTSCVVTPNSDNGIVALGGPSGLPDGGTAWFSLEEALTASQIVIGAPPPVTPIPNSLQLLLIGFAAMAAFYFGRRGFATAY